VKITPKKGSGERNLHKKFSKEEIQKKKDLKGNPLEGTNYFFSFYSKTFVGN